MQPQLLARSAGSVVSASGRSLKSRALSLGIPLSIEPGAGVRAPRAINRLRLITISHAAAVSRAIVIGRDLITDLRVDGCAYERGATACFIPNASQMIARLSAIPIILWRLWGILVKGTIRGRKIATPTTLYPV